MAVFNPPVAPTQDPNYLGYSRGTSQPAADTSYETLFKGLGETVSNTVKVVDLGIKDYLSNQIAKAVDTERDTYTANLAFTRNAAGGYPLPTDVGDRPGLTDKSNVTPREVTALDSQVEGLVAAREANKISNTYYYGRLDAIAKSYRSQWPGYREYIDQKISSLTGVTPANAYMQSIVADLNKAKTEKDDIGKYAGQELKKLAVEGNPYAAKMLEQWDVDRSDPVKVLQFVSEQRKHEWTMKNRKLEREGQQWTREDNAIQFSEDMNLEFTKMGSDGWDAIRRETGLQSPADIMDRINKHRSGEITLTQEQIEQTGQQLSAWRDQYKLAMLNKAKSDPRYRQMDPGKVNEQIEHHLKVFDIPAKALSDKNFALADAATRLTKAQMDDGQRSLLGDWNTRQFLTVTNTLKDLGGDRLTEAVLTNALIKGVKPHFINLLNKQSLEAVTPYDIRTGASVVKDINEAEAAARRANILVDPKFFQARINQIELLTDKEAALPDQAKYNLAQRYFGPANRELILKFSRDGIDPETGKRITSQNGVLGKFTQPEIVREVNRLGTQFPDLKKNYMDWVQTTFGDVMFTSEIMSLKDVHLPRGASIAYADGDNGKNPPSFRIKLNGQDVTEGESTRMMIGSRGPNTTPDSGALMQARDVIRRLNYGMGSMWNVAKETGQPVSTFILRSMQKVDPNFAQRKDVPITFPDHVMRAIGHPAGRGLQ